MENEFRKIVIIIGAARSGTKLLRDMIAEHPRIGKVPYDINYVWRIGNEKFSHDQLSPEFLTGRAQKRIQEQMDFFRKSSPVLVEKTVSNSLRIPYVKAVFPNALFIHLVRNGLDVVESTYRQWQAPPDWNYLVRKARVFPWRQAPRYAFQYGCRLLKSFLPTGKKQVATWGPRYVGIDIDVMQKSLIDVCALQWVKSVNMSLCDLVSINERRVYSVHYEDFVQKPRKSLLEIANFLDLNGAFYEKMDLNKVIPTNIGKGKVGLTAEELCRTMNIIEPTMKKLNYELN
jgi:hypothetical protein